MIKRVSVFLFLLAGMLAIEAVVALAADDTGLTTREWIERMDRTYEPVRKLGPDHFSGTGLKPFERMKWFVEPRLAEDGNLPVGARWEAYEQLRVMEQERTRGGETWFNLGPTNAAGRCLALAVHPTDPNIVYAGFASSGLWKTIDGGLAWTPLGDYLPTLSIGAIEIDADDPNRMWIGTGEGWGNVGAIHGCGVMFSTDAGVTWSQTDYTYTLNQGRDVYELEYNETNNTLLIAADNGIWRSTDDGANFTQSVAGDWRDIEYKRGSNSIVFAVRPGSGFWRSTNDGVNFTQLTSGTPPGSEIANNRFALTAADPQRILWAIANPPDGNGSSTQKGIWRSTNGGDSWSMIFGAGGHYSGQGWYDLTIEISPVSTQVVYSGGVQYYRSANGGTSFSQIGAGVHVDHHASCWAPSDPSIYYIGSDGGVYRSIDSGSSYANRNDGLTTFQFYAMAQSETLPTRAVGGTQDNGTWRYDDNPDWVKIQGADGFQCEIDYLNEQTIYTEIYYGDHYRSTTGGGGLTQINTGINDDGPWETPTFMDYSDPFILYTLHGANAYKTTNRGTLWTVMQPIAGGVSMHQCRGTPDVLVMIAGTSVNLSTDHGDTWSDETNGLLTGGVLSDVYVHPTDPNIIVVCSSTYSASIRQVNKTTNQGATWFPIDTGLPNEPANTIEIDPSNPETYYVGTDLGVYKSIDGGTTWEPFNTGLPHVVVSDLRIHDGERFLRAATFGRGLWEVDISTTSVESGPPTVQPLALRVIGNPATDRTTLHFGLQQAGNAHLGLYDLQGRELETLVDKFMFPILENVEVDLSRYPNGVYFARLDANGASLSKKVIVDR